MDNNQSQNLNELSYKYEDKEFYSQSSWSTGHIQKDDYSSIISNNYSFLPSLNIHNIRIINGKPRIVVKGSPEGAKLPDDSKRLYIEE